MHPYIHQRIFIAGFIIGLCLLAYYLYETPDYAMPEITSILGMILLCLKWGFEKNKCSDNAF